MTDLRNAAIARARSALDIAGASIAAEQRKGAFLEVAFAMLKARSFEGAMSHLGTSQNALTAEFRTKAAAMITADATFASADWVSFAQAFVGSIADGSLLDQLARFGRRLPSNRPVLIATGATGDIRREGQLKVVRQLELEAGIPDVATAVAIVALSAELVWSMGGEGRRIFEQELRNAVLRATNLEVLAMLVNSDSASVSGTGSAVGDLAAGLAAVGAASAYIAVAPPGIVAALALSEANKSGMAITGGELLPNLAVVSVAGVTAMTVIAADKIAVLDAGIVLRPSSEASVNLSDSPTAPSTLTSMFQTNVVGLLVERMFAVAGGGNQVAVVEPQS